MNLTRVREFSVAVIGAFESDKMRRRSALRRLDKELAKGNYKAAHSLLKQLQRKPGGLHGFGSAKLVPKRIPAQELCMVDSSSFQSLVDSILCSIKYSVKFAQSDEEHEVGHFLVGYLVGVLPRSYEVPSVQDITQDKFAQGNVQFLGFEFLKEVDINTTSSKWLTQGKLKTKENRIKISSQTLNRFLCVILGGLAAEHLVFGYSELLHSDVQKLDGVLRWLCFNKNEADSLVRWALVTTLSLLSHHHKARSRLAEAMTSRRSIGYCIDTIESTL